MQLIGSHYNQRCWLPNFITALKGWKSIVPARHVEDNELNTLVAWSTKRSAVIYLRCAYPFRLLIHSAMANYCQRLWSAPQKAERPSAISGLIYRARRKDVSGLALDTSRNALTYFRFLTISPSDIGPLFASLPLYQCHSYPPHEYANFIL